jgi:hypothetical protein
LDVTPLAAITALCVAGSDLGNIGGSPPKKACGIRTDGGQIFWNYLAEIEKIC